jgi:hypothetical protein
VSLTRASTGIGEFSILDACVPCRKSGEVPCGIFRATSSADMMETREESPIALGVGGRLRFLATRFSPEIAATSLGPGKGVSMGADERPDTT